MYEIAKNVILSGDFELSRMLLKLDKLSLKDQITEEQYVELVNLARENASAAIGLDEAWKADIEARLAKLEQESSQPSGVEEYVVGRRYKNGDKVFWQGKTYICIAPEGQVCVWSPDDYPAYWQAA